MSPKTFWLIVIKIAGIFLLIQALGLIPQLAITVSMGLIDTPSADFLKIALLQSICCVAFAWIIWMCLFRTEKITDILRLEKGFDGQIFKLHIARINIIRIILVLIGTWLIVESFPAFLSSLFNYYFLSRKGFSVGILANPETKYLFLQIGKFIMAYLLITCNKIIANRIDAQADKIQYYDPKERAAGPTPDNNA